MLSKQILSKSGQVGAVCISMHTNDDLHIHNYDYDIMEKYFNGYTNAFGWTFITYKCIAVIAKKSRKEIEKTQWRQQGRLHMYPIIIIYVNAPHTSRSDSGFGFSKCELNNNKDKIEFNFKI